ncbi:hypothetical protein L596_028457 [Steinernema carpocapsae]|uniref:SXP/RAL-2 family protein Ani s 5-like cation-binding domain-containing protein n=1 Tax=Steinernema carpocapsae TaxID=34508 RepID=A0A4U5LYH6_STECR|nr:hypothetical protein L596_028457 [Steinernema carpocapsae]
MLLRTILVFVATMVFLSTGRSNTDAVPSLDDIDDYNDPVLKEIFAAKPKTSSQGTSRQAGSEETDPPFLTSQGGTPPRARNFPDYESNTNYGTSHRGLPPIERPQPQTTFSNGYEGGNPGGTTNVLNNQSPYYQVGAQFGQLARTGATAFYNGAQQVGQAFGIQPYQYEVPLLNAAAGLLGR